LVPVEVQEQPGEQLGLTEHLMRYQLPQHKALQQTAVLQAPVVSVALAEQWVLEPQHLLAAQEEYNNALFKN
jgi:hypothetical protein